MGKKEFDNGTVFGIPLEKNIGFAYVQLIHIEFFGYQYKIFDKLTENLVEFKESEFINRGELIYKMLMNGTPRIRKSGERLIWKPIGVLPPTKEDLVVADFKEANSFHLKELDDWSEYKYWHVIKNMDLSNREIDINNYEKIRHLGLWKHSRYDLMTSRISMFWIKELGKDIKEYYTNDDFEDKEYRLLHYLEVENAILYSKIPKSKWNRY